MKGDYDNVVLEQSKYIGIKTNNEAEYTSLLYLLNDIKNMVPENTEILIMGDSQLVINQVTGIWSVKQTHLQNYYFKIISIIEELKKNKINCTFKWIPREQNSKADSLSNRAIKSKKLKTDDVILEKITDYIYIAHGQEDYAIDINHENCSCPYFKYHNICKHLIKAKEINKSTNSHL